MRNAQSELTNKPPTRKQFQEIQHQTAAEKNDRGAAIMLASNVQMTLKTALLAYLDLDHFSNELFGHDSAPLATFENQIRMAHALGIIGDKTRTNLKLIKSVRNAFAHAIHPITFESPEIVDACARLESPLKTQEAQEGLGAKYAVKGPPARRQFQSISNDIAFALMVQAIRTMRPAPAKDFIPNFPPHEDYVIVVRPPPLP
ncbi:MAG: hypothetical protein KGJ79_02935 [Alphaproteobacteria bacterium]|nr:hypothetical protein [Alphaproteobacteria bacterium]MDE2110071.1 hypothetical protein [Alphaproteobacteria bacterium]MDE2493002.1 hypothetical protein [Alphaproteobacteria bacterium]